MNLMESRRYCLLVAMLAVSMLLQASRLMAEETPNIIVIMADDLGYGDVSCNGATAIQTPHIDRLAKEGRRFTSGYSSASTCTPTRYSFLTGTYAFRTPGTGVAPPNASARVRPGTETIASLLKQADYRCAVIGKWHLGLGGPDAPDWNGELKPGPLELGFDHCFLLPTTNDRVPQVFVQGHRVANLDPGDPLWVGDQKPDDDHPTGISHRQTLKMDWSHGHNSTIHNGIGRIGFYTGGHAARFRDEDLADVWVQQATQWMTENHERPFFLFLASHGIHVPRMVHERFQGSTTLGPRGDAIAELDWTVGEVLGVLDRLELTDKTLIVFCSDNGPVLDDGYRDDAIEKLGSHTPAGPFRGGKYNVFEAGTRTPLIVRWPGRIAPGVSDEMVCTVDLAASFAKLVGAKIPDDACLDSLDVLDALIGNEASRGRDHLIQQDNGQQGNFGFRVGNWKLVRYESREAQNTNLRLVSQAMPPYQLFDLSSDPGERNNLVDVHPDVAEQLKQQLQQWIDNGRSRVVPQ